MYLCLGRTTADLVFLVPEASSVMKLSTKQTRKRPTRRNATERRTDGRTEGGRKRGQAGRHPTNVSDHYESLSRHRPCSSSRRARRRRRSLVPSSLCPSLALVSHGTANVPHCAYLALRPRRRQHLHRHAAPRRFHVLNKELEESLPIVPDVDSSHSSATQPPVLRSAQCGPSLLHDPVSSFPKGFPKETSSESC